jgi:hypothetical protein
MAGAIPGQGFDIAGMFSNFDIYIVQFPDYPKMTNSDTRQKTHQCEQGVN